jgi:hypothetical protein
MGMTQVTCETCKRRVAANQPGGTKPDLHSRKIPGSDRWGRCPGSKPVKK